MDPDETLGKLAMPWRRRTEVLTSWVVPVSDDRLSAGLGCCERADFDPTRSHADLRDAPGIGHPPHTPPAVHPGKSSSLSDRDLKVDVQAELRASRRSPISIEFAKP